MYIQNVINVLLINTDKRRRRMKKTSNYVSNKDIQMFMNQIMDLQRKILEVEIKHGKRLVALEKQQENKE